MTLKLDEQWAELFTLALLVVGFIVSILLMKSYFSYLIVFFSGALAARIYYIKKFKEPIFPFILIIAGFLVGYFAGSFWVSRILVLIFFGLGFGISYYLHLKKILVIFKSENFVK